MSKLKKKKKRIQTQTEIHDSYFMCQTVSWAKRFHEQVLLLHKEIPHLYVIAYFILKVKLLSCFWLFVTL